MSLRQYFTVDRADGKKANVIDYAAAAVMAVMMIVFIIIPYAILCLFAVCVMSAYAHIVYWWTGEKPCRGDRNDKG